MFDDDAARRALRTLTDEPAPLAKTTVEQVLRRGRRRVFVQRASTVAGVVAVVAVIGVGAVLLRSAVGHQAPAADNDTAVPTSMPLPGWERVPNPGDDSPADGSCKQEYRPPHEPDVPLPSESTVKNAFIGATKTAAGRVTKADSTWLANSPRHAGAPRGYVNLELPMDNGTGQVQLEVSRYGGTPEQVADGSVAAYGQCGEPWRRTLADGTVLQLYPLDTRDAEAPSQHLQIYRPGGLEYIVTSAGWSAADMIPVDGGGMTLGGGRGKVPVTEVQLTMIAERLVVMLE
jgi:hypothetical protein